MAKIVTIDGQKYQIGNLGGIRKIGADGRPTGGQVKDPKLRKKIREKYQMSGSEPMGFMTEKPKKSPPSKPKTSTVRNTKTPKPKPSAPKAKAKPTGMSDRKSKQRTSGIELYRPGRGDSKLTPKKKEAKNPNAAFKSARDKQRRAGKLSNKSVRDTSIKDARPARGPAYDTKAPKKTTSQKAIEAIRKRNEKAVNPLSKAMLGRIEKKLKEGGKPVYKDGIVVGVTHKGIIGTVYTGRPDSNPFKRKKKKRD
tara:strand:+ start:1458 stop:2216 length:759 start_codon:yes stop_codon:yes gene_type:complete